MDAQRFFMTAIPTRVRDNSEAFLALTGTLVVHVRARGSYTVSFGDIRHPVVEGAAESADLQVWFSRQAFAAFVDGTLDPSTLGPADLLHKGDARMLEQLGHFLQPPASPLAARFGMA